MQNSRDNSNHNNRVLVINDLAGHSNTSLMSIIPIMHAMGIPITVLPTAILSSNTEHKGYQMVDMTEHLEAFLRHWSDLGLAFNAVYSGFLSSEKQVDVVIEAINMFKKSGTFIVVDPVMADDGELYPCYNKDIIISMQNLISHADLIAPNLTEAAFLLKEPYQSVIKLQEVENWCKRLSQFGPEQIVITNVPDESNSELTSVVCYDKTRNYIHRSFCRHYSVNYPGTGDIFASVLTCLLLKGSGLFPAVDKTVKFMCEAIEATIALKSPVNEGISLETVLNRLPKP